MLNEEGRRARTAAQRQWSRHPAGTTLVDAEEVSPEFYRQMTEARYRLQPWHPALIRRFGLSGRLLEIGCGAGTDHAELAQYVDDPTVAIDLTYKGAWLTRQREVLEGRRGLVIVADGEQLPFRDDVFDVIYSFGVIHHTDHPECVADEMHRVMKPRGRFLVGLYHRASLVTAKLLLVYVSRGIFRRERWSDYLPLVEAGAEELDERPVVRLYSRREAKRLFTRFTGVRIEVVHSGFEAPVLSGLGRIWGWYVIVTGRKP